MKKAKAKKRKVQPIPKGYHDVTPYLSVRGAAAAIDFYKKAFGAKEIMRMPGPEGKIGHAEIAIGGSRVMLADEYEAMQFLGPQARGGSTVHLHVYMKDADATVERAVKAGAKIVRPVQLRRPAGHHRGSVRPRVAPRHPRRGRAAEGDEAAGGGDGGEG